MSSLKSRQTDVSVFVRQRYRCLLKYANPILRSRQTEVSVFVRIGRLNYQIQTGRGIGVCSILRSRQAEVSAFVKMVRGTVIAQFSDLYSRIYEIDFKDLTYVFQDIFVHLVLSDNRLIFLRL
jgi:hypothetical protein